MSKPQIIKCIAKEILDSRGNPTVEANVFLADDVIGSASVPSGASTGIFEACEKRDEDPGRYNGKGVTSAVVAVNRQISPNIAGMMASEQQHLDNLLITLDGTDNKSKLGANAILAVSLANAKAAANYYHIPLYRHIGGLAACRLPIPMMNIINGGAHASNNIDIQEFMIVPFGFAKFSDALRAGSEIYHALGSLLKKKELSTGVGDEGGYAPSLNDETEAIDLINEAITLAGYSNAEVGIALDAAASEWFDEDSKKYVQPKAKKEFTTDDLISYWDKLCDKYPMIMSIEDALDQRDHDGWSKLTERLGNRIMLVGDDLFVTNTALLKKGIESKIANTILIKPNQIGTLSETLDVINVAKEAGYKFILSHRSGETEDTTIADIAVATNAMFIKSGAPCRSDRVAKYNRLLRIEASLGNAAIYGLK